ncbi:MAG: GNAT family N-acetyltransferase [Acholeplasmataceae bacterium]|nr:GNAT family N-acetyltransferase [Acholeplasmataceae bacterium]
MIKFRFLEDLKGYGHFSKDFMKVSAFLAEFHRDELVPMSYPWGRWEWMFSLPFLDADHIDNIGVWEDDGVIVALMTYESVFGEAYYVLNHLYPYLRKEIAQYALKYLQSENGFRMLVPDTDREMQKIVYKMGLYATSEKESLAAIDLNQMLDYKLPQGYYIENMKDHLDIKRYHQVLWRGFNHAGEPTMTEEDLKNRKISLSGPHVNLNRNIAVVEPHGDYVSYCGTWYQEGSTVALVEPVATDPHYRKMGLGRAAVLEALTRCKRAGAKYALVGSSQDFYYRLGFYPYANYTWWKLDKK